MDSLTRNDLRLLNNHTTTRLIHALLRYPKRTRWLKHELGHRGMASIYTKLRELEKAGYAEKFPDPNHKQAFLWKLTTKGELLYERYLKEVK